MQNIETHHMNIYPYPIDYMHLTKDGETFKKDSGSVYYDAECLMDYMAKVYDIDDRLCEFFKREYGVNADKNIPGTTLYQSAGLYRIFSSLHLSPYDADLNKDITDNKFFVYIQNEFVNKYTLLRTGKCIEIASKDDILDALMNNGVCDTNIKEISRILPSLE